MKVVAYLKQQCGWSRGVREVLAKCGIEYEEKQIHIPDNFIEMVEKTGQHMQPCVQFDGVVSYCHPDFRCGGLSVQTDLLDPLSNSSGS